MASVSASGGAIGLRSNSNDDDFERKLKEMLKEGTVAGHQSGAFVHGGVSPDMTFIGGGGSSGVEYQRWGPSGAEPSAPMYGAQTSPNSVPGSPGYFSPAEMSNISLSTPRSAASSAAAPAPRPRSAPASGPSAALSPTAPPLQSPLQSKLDGWREWSFSTYRFTRQLISERLGRAPRTVDAELEAAIDLLRETQAKYTHVLQLSRALAAHFQRTQATQRAMGEAFGELALKNPELREEFAYNAETQKVLVLNGDTLLRAMNTFTATLDTLVNKTVTDTLLTVKQYEAARVEYDAYRLDLEALGAAPTSAQAALKMADAQARHQMHKDRYERLRADVSIKLKFLDENRVKVMHKQLLLFQTAVTAYFSGNQAGLEESLKQFNIRQVTPSSERLSSFLQSQK